MKFKLMLEDFEQAKKESQQMKDTMDSVEGAIIPGAAPPGSAISSSLALQPASLNMGMAYGSQSQQASAFNKTAAMIASTSHPPPGSPYSPNFATQSTKVDNYQPQYDPFAEMTNRMTPLFETMDQALKMSVQSATSNSLAGTPSGPAPSPDTQGTKTLPHSAAKDANLVRQQQIEE
jgi:hypothetical protein